MSDNTISFLSNFSGVLLGGIISLVIFQWQRIKKEQSFAGILIDILDTSEVNQIMEEIEFLDKQIELDKDEEEKMEYFNFIMQLNYFAMPLINKLPDLRTSYEIGTGYIYNIIELRTTYNKLEQIKFLISFVMSHEIFQ